MACLFLKHLLNFLCSPSFVYFISFNETTVPGSAAIIFILFPFPSTSYGMTTRRRVLAMRKALKISKTSHTFLINFSSADYLATFVHICCLTISTAMVLCTDFCSLHGKQIYWSEYIYLYLSVHLQYVYIYQSTSLIQWPSNLMQAVQRANMAGHPGESRFGNGMDTSRLVL